MANSADEAEFVPLPARFEPGESCTEAARSFYERMCSRRTVRMFSDESVPLECIEWLVRAAGSSPSGANKQPWSFVCVKDKALKRQIRAAAEREEREFYRRRANAEWLADLAPLGTDEVKPYLEIAPWLIVVFKHKRGRDGSQVYYPQESVGIATGMLLCAAHHAGLVTLTHTPSPMSFLTKILGRPDNEIPYLLIPIGYPAADCVVPRHGMSRKALSEIMSIDGS